MKHKHFIVTALFLSFALLSSTALGLTLSEEKKYGKEVFAEAARSAKINSDPYISFYTHEIRARLEEIANMPFPVVLTIIESNTVDAFATMGGYVFITTGLIAQCGNEKELAGVMAHEFAHIKKRHISKRLEKQKFINITTLATLVAGMLIGNQAGGAVVAAGSSAGMAMSLQYSREDEEEADREGSVIANKAGYGGLGIADFLKKLRSGGGDKLLPQYLMTHPYHESRIITLENAWPSNKITIESDFFPYVLVRANFIGKVRGPGADDVWINRHLKDMDNPVFSYAASLVQAQKGNTNESVQILSHINSPYKPLLLGEALVNARQHNEAITLLRNNRDPTARYFLAKAYEGRGDVEMAISTLEGLIPYGSVYPDIFYKFAMLLGRTGNERQGFEYLGKYYLELGRYDLARTNFEKAIAKYGVNSY